MAKAAVIVADGLTKIFGSDESRVVALADASFRVGAGEWLAIVGRSGSGKSTLLNLLGLLDRPTAGRYTLDGREVADLHGRALAQARRELIGFVFQSFNLLPRESVLKNVELPMIYADIAPRERRRRAMAALERVGLGDRLGHTPPQLSGGQKQRVAIARALVNEPTMLLADEPTGNLDSTSGANILDLFGALNADGVTLVVVTHDPLVAGRAGRVIEIRDGRSYEQPTTIIPARVALPDLAGVA